MKNPLLISALNPSVAQFKTIQGISFTAREIDVIACFLNGKAIKTTASFLLMSPKTVETHARSVMLKLGCNSREGIIVFIEKSPQYSLVKNHYSYLLRHQAFKQALQKIALLNRKDSTSLIIYDLGAKKYRSLFEEFVNYLNLIGIKASIADNTPPSLPLLNNSSVIGLVCQEGRGLITPLLFLMEESISTEIPKEIREAGYISFAALENIDSFLAFFEFIKKILPSTALEPIITEFKNQYKGFQNQLEILHAKKEEPSKILPITFTAKQKNLVSLPNHSKTSSFSFTYLITLSGGIASIAALVFSLWTYSLLNIKDQNIFSSIIKVRSDLSIPHQKGLLKREQLLKRINTCFSNQSPGIQSVTLVGTGGAGKTTLARFYAKQQQNSIVWEVNAETRESLINSFKDLAYAITKTTADKNELHLIQQISNQLEREKQLMIFIRHRLKESSPWILIYDNVENLTALKSFVPEDHTVWGSGNVIITTRDSNSENTGYIASENIIHVDELTQTEASTLFTLIYNGKSFNQLSLSQQAVTSNFLKNIPPFPLDISVAAYYLKATNASFGQYLDNLKQNSHGFEDMQVNLLKETGYYIKTRYNIVGLSLKYFIDSNKDFEELLLFISVLDSQNIPRDLLDRYKNNVLVDKLIFNLKKFSLVTGESNSPLGFSIHRSTHNIMLEYITRKLNLRQNKKFLYQIADTFEYYISEAIDQVNAMKMVNLLRHCEVFSSNDLLDNKTKIIMQILLGKINYFIEPYAYKKIIQILTKSIEELKKHNKEEYFLIAKTLTYLGDTYRLGGDYEKAQYVLEESKAIFDKYLMHHGGIKQWIELARTTTSLASIYTAFNNYLKAQKFFEYSAKIFEVHSKTHVGAARNLAYWGILYRDLGLYKKAKSLLVKSTEIYQNTSEHRLAWTLGYLGDICRKEGSYLEAINLLRQSLDIYQRLHYPETHIDRARVSIFLGIAYGDLGKYKEGISLIEKGIAIFEKLYPTHYDVVWFIAHLSDLYRKVGDLKKAKNLIIKLILLNEAHPYDNMRTTWLQVKAALVYDESGKPNKTWGFFQRSIEIYKKRTFPDKNNINNTEILRLLGPVL